jgi:hypothetical protein
MEKKMKISKCLMSVLLSTVLLFSSAFAGNSLHKDKTIETYKTKVVINENRGVCDESFVVYGSDPDGVDPSGYEVGECWADGSGYFYLYWEGGCVMTGMEYSGGFMDLEYYGFTEGFYFFGFAPGATETFVVNFDDMTTAADDATSDCASCEDNGQITCPDGSCVDDEADCPETDNCEAAGGVLLWINDGWCDASNNNAECTFDGGDCCPCTCVDSTYDCATYGGTCDDCIVDGDASATCPDECAPAVCGDGACTSGEDCNSCPEDCGECGDCAAGEVADCDESGECWTEGWIGDGYCDGTAQQYGADLCCYDMDGGDCTAAECEDAPDPYCGDGACNGDETEASCPEDCSGGGGASCAGICGSGYGEPGCYDAITCECYCDDACEGFGDCCADYAAECLSSCEDEGLVTCWDGSCAASEANCPDAPEVPDPSGVCIAGDNYSGYPAITMSWDISTECGDGACNGDEDYMNCPEDCNAPGECDPGYMADCDESGECWTESWCGDGLCDGTAQQYGADLCCYDLDCGDCTEADCEDVATCEDEGLVTCWDGSCEVSETDCPEQGGCAETFTVAGSDPSIGDCYTDGSGYYSFYWEGGCLATYIEYGGGGMDISTYGFTDGFIFYGFGAGECYDFVITFDNGETAAATVCNDCASCDELGQVTCWDGSCADTEVDCPEEGDCGDGYVVNCNPAGGDPCCPESWIGDGYEDCEDQAYGCDLTCYDNDGGDCGPSESCADQGLVDCPDGSCAATPDDCPEASCSDVGGIDSWMSDGYCDSINNNETCSYDGGDCCLSTCVDGPTYSCGDSTGPCVADSCIDPDGNNDDCGGRSADYGKPSFKRGQAPLVSNVVHHGRTAGFLAKLNAVPNFTSDYDGQAVRVGEEINSHTRELMATVAYSCDACVSGGPWSGSWDVAAMDFGYFTLYGLDAGSEVCGTLTFCDGGACSDTVGPLCANAGDTDSSECAEDDSCPSDAGSGDVNADGDSNVLDIVQIVNYILGGSLDDCQLAAADMNGDGQANVLDIVQIVNGILGGRVDVGDATSGQLIKSNGALTLEANGYIGGVQMTLSHDGDFSIDLTDKAMVAEYNTVGNETILVIVAPEGEELFTYTGDFEIVDMIVANSQGRVNVGAPVEFSLSTAYPNPFNPTTSLELSVPMNGHVTVQVYNLMGQVVATLANGYMDASTYTLTWDASNVSSGMYIVKAEAAGTVSTQKLMLMK